MAEFHCICTAGRSFQTGVHPYSVPTISSHPKAALSLLAFIFVAIASLGLQGCAGGSTASLNPTSQPGNKTTLSPSSASIQVWQNLQFSVSGPDTSNCTWTSSQPGILASLGNGQFQGAQPGTATVSTTCGSATASASVVISAQQQSAPITITSGGTYSGNWVSNDPSTPAVTIKTSAPVVLHDSVISSRGDLIRITGSNSGANVTIQNVTGTALDPNKYGVERGAFISSGNVSSLIVKNCSMIGVSFGIKLVSATPSTLQILNNEATDMEDRASDGHGGLLTTRALRGHFLILNNVSATGGAEIAWNKVTQTIGSSSVEDVFNVYSSQGSAAHPIWLHDNYMEGASSPSNLTDYSGVGIIADGTTANGNPATAYVLFEDNQVVKTAGGGIAIAAGHDVTARNNRVVTCGMSADGTWYNHSGVAAYIWNFYGSELFYNNSITATGGGMVNPGSNSSPIAHDLWVNPTDAARPGVSAIGNNFTDPCLASGSINLQAEEEERTLWAQKTSSNAQFIGDQHLN